jgi:hypothetical protein
LYIARLRCKLILNELNGIEEQLEIAKKIPDIETSPVIFFNLNLIKSKTR